MPIFKKISVYILIFAFAVNMTAPAVPASAATIAGLPEPGSMVPVSRQYLPALLKGMSLRPDNPLQFDFLVDTGDGAAQGPAVRQEATKLIKYFMAALTVPDEELWVNLSPYEGDRIVSRDFGQTEMGRDLLAQDYLLKQLTASMMYPEEDLGKAFWDRVNTKAQEMYGTVNIPVNTFNKIWIVPDKAVVFEDKGTAFIVESRLKVMLEEDYVALKESKKQEKFGTANMPDEKAEELSKVTSDVVREVLCPEIEKEVNTGENFAQLRQIYHAMILATWFKRTLKESLLGQVYVDRRKTKGIDIEDKEIKQKIYKQYLEAFQTGVFSFIKEEFNPVTQQLIPRKYFSGGFDYDIEKAYSRVTEENWGMLTPQAQTDYREQLEQGLDGYGSLLRIGTSLIENTDEQTIAQAGGRELEDRAMLSEIAERIEQNWRGPIAGLGENILTQLRNLEPNQTPEAVTLLMTLRDSAPLQSDRNLVQEELTALRQQLARPSLAADQAMMTVESPVVELRRLMENRSLSQLKSDLLSRDLVLEGLPADNTRAKDALAQAEDVLLVNGQLFTGERAALLSEGTTIFTISKEPLSQRILSQVEREMQNVVIVSQGSMTEEKEFLALSSLLRENTFQGAINQLEGRGIRLEGPVTYEEAGGEEVLSDTTIFDMTTGEELNVEDNAEVLEADSTRFLTIVPAETADEFAQMLEGVILARVDHSTLNTDQIKLLNGQSAQVSAYLKEKTGQLENILEQLTAQEIDRRQAVQEIIGVTQEVPRQLKAPTSDPLQMAVNQLLFNGFADAKDGTELGIQFDLTHQLESISLVINRIPRGGGPGLSDSEAVSEIRKLLPEIRTITDFLDRTARSETLSLLQVRQPVSNRILDVINPFSVQGLDQAMLTLLDNAQKIDAAAVTEEQRLAAEHTAALSAELARSVKAYISDPVFEQFFNSVDQWLAENPAGSLQGLSEAELRRKVAPLSRSLTTLTGMIISEDTAALWRNFLSTRRQQEALIFSPSGDLQVKTLDDLQATPFANDWLYLPVDLTNAIFTRSFTLSSRLLARLRNPRMVNQPETREMLEAIQSSRLRRDALQKLLSDLQNVPDIDPQETARWLESVPQGDQANKYLELYRDYLMPLQTVLRNGDRAMLTRDQALDVIANVNNLVSESRYRDVPFEGRGTLESGVQILSDFIGQASRENIPGAYGFTPRPLRQHEMAFARVAIQSINNMLNNLPFDRLVLQNALDFLYRSLGGEQLSAEVRGSYIQRLKEIEARSRQTSGTAAGVIDFPVASRGEEEEGKVSIGILSAEGETFGIDLNSSYRLTLTNTSEQEKTVINLQGDGTRLWTPSFGERQVITSEGIPYGVEGAAFWGEISFVDDMVPVLTVKSFTEAGVAFELQEVPQGQPLTTARQEPAVVSGLQAVDLTDIEASSGVFRTEEGFTLEGFELSPNGQRLQGSSKNEARDVNMDLTVRGKGVRGLTVLFEQLSQDKGADRFRPGLPISSNIILSGVQEVRFDSETGDTVIIQEDREGNRLQKTYSAWGILSVRDADQVMLNPEPVAEVEAKKTENVGGIDLDPTLLNLQIKRDPNGVPLPIPQQPIQDMNIDGFYPVILNISPANNLHLLLGENERQPPQLQISQL